MHVEDIVVDSLTFPIATGQEEVRRDGIETIEAIKQLKRALPAGPDDAGPVQHLLRPQPGRAPGAELGVPAECIDAGLDTAIVNAAKILPMSQIDDDQRDAALDLVYDRRREERDTPDPLQHFMNLFEGVSAQSSKDQREEELAAMPLFERLARRIVDGEPQRPRGRPRRGTGGEGPARDHQRRPARSA